MKKILIIIACNVLIFVGYAGGGWTKKKKEGFFKFSQYVLRADQYYNPEGNIIGISPGVALYSSSIYAEYGFTDRLMGIIYFPFFSRAVLNSLEKINGEFEKGEAINSLGDADFGLEYGIIRDKPFVLSARFSVGIPLGEAQGGEMGVLQTGDGEFNQMISLNAGWSLYPLPAYVSGTVAFNNRSKEFSDEIRFGFEAGYTIKNKLTLIARFLGVKSLRNSVTDPNSIQGVFGNNIEYMSFSPEIVYEIKEKFGFSFSVGTAFSGSQVLANPSLEAGFYIKTQK